MNVKTEATYFTKFAIVGVIATILDFLLSNTFLLIISSGNPNADLRIATTLSYLIAVMFNFLMNRYWIYPTTQGQTTKQVVQFYMVYGVSLIIRLIVLTIAFPIWQRLVGQVISNNVDTLASNLTLATAIAVTMLWNFGVNRLWTFGDVKTGQKTRPVSPSAD